MVRVPQGIISLLGANFTAASTVLFDGAVANSSFQNSSLIEVSLDFSVFLVAKTHTLQVSDPATGNSGILTYDVYSPQTGPFDFQGQPRLSPASNPAGKGVLADVNGDGLSDLISFTPEMGGVPGQLTISFGQKDGTFAQPVSAGFTLANGPPLKVLAGDFNNDGSPDLTLIYQSSYVVLLNNGSGQFTNGFTGSIPTTIANTLTGRAAVGDFNGDGHLHFVVEADLVPTIAVFLGNGNGTFGNIIYPLANTPVLAGEIVAADLNADGITDLICIDNLLNGSSLELHTLLFHSDGSATDTLTAGVTATPWAFAVGDFNNDRIPDLFVVDAITGAGQTFAGNGDGTFTAIGTPVFASDGFLAPPPFVTGDFDNDGNVDILTRLTLFGPDEILFLWGDGHGNFTGQTIASDQSFYLTTGDVNGDGIPDILESGIFAQPGVILGRQDHNFASPKQLLNSPEGTLSWGNVFNDGSRAILVAGIGNCTAGSGNAGAIYEIQANNVPVEKTAAPECDAVLADVDGDGIADLVGYSGSAILIWKGDGTGNFQAPVAEIPVSGAEAAWEFAFRDMDGDGHTDIVVSGAIFYGKGNMQFDVVPVPATVNQEFLVGDFDGDGVPDIFMANGILFGQGNRTFTAPTGVNTVPQCWSGFALPVVADINRDGKDDAICSSDVPQLIEIYTGAGRSGFVQDQVLFIPDNYNVSTVNTISVGDFNADGLMDIAIGTGTNDDVDIFTNDGKGEFLLSSYAVGTSPAFSIVGDFNQDGSPDMAFLGLVIEYKPYTVEVLFHK